jgi:hypothetical protein
MTQFTNGFLLTHSLQSPIFSGMTEEDLTRLKIEFTGFISLKPNLEECIVATTSLGENELWSSTNLYHQLHLLESLIPRTVCNDLPTFALLSSHTLLD